MNKKLLVLIPAFILLFSMACVLNRFTRRGTAATSVTIPTYTQSNPSTTVVTEATISPPPTPTKTPATVQVTATIQPSAGSTYPTLFNTASGIGIPVDCDNLIQIEVLSAPVFYHYLNLLKANGTWLVLHLQMTNLQGETYNFLNENDFTIVSTSSGQTVHVAPTQLANIEAYYVWDYSAYLVDPLPGYGTSPRIVVFDVDPAIKDWTFVFTPKESIYSTSPYCTVEIPLH